METETPIDDPRPEDDTSVNSDVHEPPSEGPEREDLPSEDDLIDPADGGGRKKQEA